MMMATTFPSTTHPKFNQDLTMLMSIPSRLHDDSISSTSGRMPALLLQPDEAGLAKAGEALRAGGLVAFPTETVFGLGANALDEEAVRSIFRVKGRPLTDPLIVHISSLEQSLELVVLEGQDRSIFVSLATHFWPGPLTLIARASAKIPPTVTAGTGFVGVRLPSHPVAQRLIKAAAVPISAPSANRFGHVSPTRAQHVIDDLGHAELLVVDADVTSSTGTTPASNGESSSSSCCEYGIESTVIKVEGGALLVLRRGAVTQRQLEEALASNGLDHVSITAVQRQEREEVQQEAPGQLITHYAPDVDTYLVTVDGPPLEEERQANGNGKGEGLVVIDFAGRLKWLEGLGHVAYRSLSEGGDMREAGRRLFETLRWAENVPGASRVLLVDLSGVEDDFTAGVADRMMRAASGKRVTLRPGEIPQQVDR